jgi:hypothetical protein
MKDFIASAPDTDRQGLKIPPGYVGPIALLGSQREIYWTGRIAIGLRYEGPARRPGGPHAGATRTVPSWA